MCVRMALRLANRYPIPPLAARRPGIRLEGDGRWMSAPQLRLALQGCSLGLTTSLSKALC